METVWSTSEVILGAETLVTMRKRRERRVSVVCQDIAGYWIIMAEKRGDITVCTKIHQKPNAQNVTFTFVSHPSVTDGHMDI